MYPKVSVGIPAYKSAFLKQAIDSVLKQTYTDLELVIVNDNSPESITDIVNSYNDHRIRYYINERNMGWEDPAVNWNKCLSYANGEFFALLCDDDYYEPSFLEEMLSLADKYPNVSVFRSRVKNINEDNQVLDYYPSSPEWESCLDYMWHKVNRFRKQSISEFLLRREYIVSLGGYSLFPKAWFADEISIYRFSEEAGIVSTNKLLSTSRVSTLNISGNNNLYTLQKIRACNLYFEWLKQFSPAKNSEYTEGIFQKCEGWRRMDITKYLIKATWKDFIFIWLQRKSEQYNICSWDFVKALAKRFYEKVRKFYAKCLHVTFHNYSDI